MAAGDHFELAEKSYYRISHHFQINKQLFFKFKKNAWKNWLLSISHQYAIFFKYLFLNW